MIRLVLLVAFIGALPGPVSAQPLTVELVNHSEPTTCAEHDNVDLRLTGPSVGRFMIEALPPVYLDEIRVDSTEPDWRGCPPHENTTDFRFEPRSLVLHEADGVRLVGHTFSHFWRLDVATFQVAGGPIEQGLHLVQLFRQEAGTWQEFLVLYPSDGYWRAKPLPPAELGDGSYGTSFLIGPIEERGRPIVDVAAVTFDPKALRFDLAFRKGGAGTLTVTAAGQDRTALEATLDPPVAGAPFAAIRSMYVNRWRADAGEVTLTDAAGQVLSLPIMTFDRASASRVRFGRNEMSQHNLSAPDVRFGAFGAP